jgi:WD40 repeat protein
MLFAPSCSKSPTAPAAVPYDGPIVSADLTPVWSPDGHLIAFRRASFSSAGPPGVYVVPAIGGPIRYIAPGDNFWPRNLTFSPDSKRLAFCAGLQIYVADIQSATYWQPLYAENGANYPSWSPDGRSMLYSRVGIADTTTWPIDSSGIHRLDLVTGQDQAVWSDQVQPNGTHILFGQYPQWSADGRTIACLQGTDRGTRIVAIGSDGTSFRVLATSPDGDVYDLLRRYARPKRGLDGLAFGQITGPASGSYFVGWNGTGPMKLPYAIHPHLAFSPDGEWKVESGMIPRDSAGVLYVQRVDDAIGLTRRQLTFWAPP